MRAAAGPPRARGSRRRGGRGRSRAAELAAATPADRNRCVDLFRALAIGAVVLGHWLAAAIVYHNGRLEGDNALALLAWTHRVTWLFQVMPLFFLVGGYANAASWDSHRGRGGDWVAWVQRRTGRLLRPTGVFIAALAVAGLAARLAGVDAQAAADALWLAGISLWFLVVYVAVSAAAPAMLAAHRRWGLAVPAALAVAVAAVDLASIGLGVPVVGAANFALGWAAIHQLGFAWRDGTLTGTPAASVALAGGGLVALVALTELGPYPVSMVGVPGAELDNTSPPSLALLALAACHTGVVLLARRPLARWLQRRRVWTAVVAVNGVVLSVFLWHMVPVVVAAAALYPSGLMPQPPVGSPAWLALRPLWVAALAVILLPIVALFARFERLPPRRRRPVVQRRPAWAPPLAAAGIAAACAAMHQLTAGGFRGAGPGGLPVAALAAFALGQVLLHVAARAGKTAADEDGNPAAG